MDDDVFSDIDDAAASFKQPVGTLMADRIISTPGSTTLRAAAALMQEAGVGLLVVGTADDVQGVVSERDIVAAVAGGRDLDSETVGAAAGQVLKWAAPTSSVADVIEEMMESYLRHILVMGENGKLVGVVSMRDVLAAFPG